VKQLTVSSGRANWSLSLTHRAVVGCARRTGRSGSRQDQSRPLSAVVRAGPDHRGSRCNDRWHVAGPGALTKRKGPSRASTSELRPPSLGAAPRPEEGRVGDPSRRLRSERIHSSPSNPLETKSTAKRSPTSTVQAGSSKSVQSRARIVSSRNTAIRCGIADRWIPAMWRRASGELVRGSSAVRIHSGVAPDIVCFVRASAALSVMVREIAGGPFAEDENAVEALAPGEPMNRSATGFPGWSQERDHRAGTFFGSEPTDRPLPCG